MGCFPCCWKTYHVEDDEENCKNNQKLPSFWKITEFKWGQITVGGETFKDAIIFPNKVKEWDWRDTGMRHSPGIRIVDVQIFENIGVTDVVLTRGVEDKLLVTADAVDYLKQKNITVHVDLTEPAIKIYNELIEQRGKIVGGLFHSTC